MFKVDKGVPIPAIKKSPQYPWLDMEIGDSFWTDKPSAREAASIWGIKHDMKFVTRKTEGGFRVWRVA